MAKNGRKLKAAFLRKEETQGFLSNLEKLKEDGSVAEEQYEPLQGEYHQRLSTAESEIVSIKNGLKRELESRKRDLGTYKVELERLSIKHKVGEVPLEKYRSTDQKLRRRIEQIENNISQLETLVGANSSADISVVASRLGFGAPGLPSFAEFVTSPQQLVKPPTRLLGPAGGLFILLSVFLPWLSVPPYGLGLSGTGTSGLIEAAGITCGLVGLCAALLAQAPRRGLLHIGVGLVALIAVLAVFLPDWLPLLKEVGLTSIRAGVYIYLLACIAVVVGGVLDLTAKRGDLGKEVRK